MAGILGALGVNNGFTDFLNSHRGALTNFGVGLASGVNPSQGIALGTQGLATGRVQDDAYATQQKEVQARQEAMTATQKALAKYPDLAALAASGADIGPILSEYFKRTSPGYGATPQPDPFTLGPGQTRYAPDGTPLASVPVAADKPATPPNGYRYAADGASLEFIPGGPADPSTAGKTTEATRRNQQLAKVITPEAASLLGDGTHPGTFDALTDTGNIARANTPGAQMLGQGPSAEYQQAQASIKTIIASYLYSVSGATANPGEVETLAATLIPQINESPQAIAAKKARLAQMVQAVQDAAQGNAGAFSADQPSAAPNTTSSGIQWSVEP